MRRLLRKIGDALEAAWIMILLWLLDLGGEDGGEFDP